MLVDIYLTRKQTHGTKMVSGDGIQKMASLIKTVQRNFSKRRKKQRHNRIGNQKTGVPQGKGGGGGPKEE